MQRIPKRSILVRFAPADSAATPARPFPEVNFMSKFVSFVTVAAFALTAASASAPISRAPFVSSSRSHLAARRTSSPA